MSSSRRLSRTLLAASLAVAAVLPLAASAQARPLPPAVPTAIKVPAGNSVFLVGHATGVQIYACNATGWGFVAPRANLYDDRGRLIISHFAGPTWQSARDGSKVVGSLVASAGVKPTAIPWLLLSAASTTPGRLGGTTYIQRIATTGGLAPAASTCTKATLGTQAEVPYTADYFFWRKGDCPVQPATTEDVLAG